jgi:hypothetical protein
MSREDLMKDVLLGQGATELLNSDAFKAAVDQVERKTIQAWKGANLATSREEAWHRLKALNDIQAELRAMTGAKRIAEDQLKE